MMFTNKTPRIAAGTRLHTTNKQELQQPTTNDTICFVANGHGAQTT